MNQAWQSWQRRRWPWIAAAVLAGSIFIFIVAGLLTPSPSAQQITAASSNSEMAQAEFFNVVIFGVDDLQRSSPRLEAIWIGTFELVGKDGVLLGLPRTFQITNNQSIEQAFTWTPDMGTDPDFLSSVEATLGLHFNSTVVMDGICFQAMIDSVGGIPMENGRSLDGLSALALHKLSVNDPWMALAVQAKILTGASLRAAEVGDLLDLSLLIDLTPNHCWLSMSRESAVELILRMLPIQEGAIRVETLTAAE